MAIGCAAIGSEPGPAELRLLRPPVAVQAVAPQPPPVRLPAQAGERPVRAGAGTVTAVLACGGAMGGVLGLYVVAVAAYR
ncbi:hypothetical protein [Streptomyces sp. NPDC047028]|uniref:hypothetical protein n=1 Tax=Streptomyces sp. NPDC047028 TaxID=3155793 RepID=UPI0033F30355